MINPHDIKDIKETFHHLFPRHEILRCYWAFEGDFRIIARERSTPNPEERYTTEFRIENGKTLIGFRKK